MIKIPSSVLICGMPYKVKTNPNHDGGEFSEEDRLIEVGVGNPNKAPDVFLHEVIEACLAIRNMRYIKQKAEVDNGDYLFAFSHEQFEQLVSDVAAALAGVNFPKLTKPK